MLNGRCQVTQHEEFTVLIAVGYDGFEVGQHVQLRLQRIPRIHIHVITTGPKEGALIFFDLDPFEIHSPCG